MRVAVLGAGPAGLYLAYLLRRGGLADVRVIEQNPAEATFGFGVVFSDRALEFLADDDPDTYAAVTPHLESWHDITLHHRGETVRIDGIGFAAIGRLELLSLLRDRARSVGVEPVYDRIVGDIGELEPADLIVGADGVNSLVRQSHDFGTGVEPFTNRFAWFGTTRPFATLSQTFRETELGHFNAHHYRYAPAMSTFIVEVDEATFLRAGFDRMPEDEARGVCEQVFADALDGHRLISNRSIWRRFPNVANARWWHGNRVLIGDALRTAHFSIGSGTRLAMEDAIALARAIGEHPRDLAEALQAYETARRPVVDKLVAAATASGRWYERFADHMDLEPIDFAMSYLTRSGRIDIERLRRIAPEFVARYERERPTASP